MSWIEESVPYQRAVARVLRVGLLCVGVEKFGEPDAVSLVRLEQIKDVKELESLALRMVFVSSWQALLPPPDK